MNQKVLRQLQYTEFEILKEIRRICEENQLSYYLIGGTLLGAVRHKGFIPWDDDLDVAMPRDDYNKFISICKTQLDKKYYIHDISTYDNYWLPFAKIRKKNTLFNERNISHLNLPKEIYVDIFPMDDAKCEISFPKSLQTSIIKMLNVVILGKINYFVNKKTSFKNKILNFLFSPFKLKTIYNFQKNLMSLNNGKNYPFFVNFGSNYNAIKQTIPKEKFSPAIKLEFEGEFFDAPNDFDYVLRRIYGDSYMQLPPEEKRITHNPVSLIFDTLNTNDNLSAHTEA